MSNNKDFLVVTKSMKGVIAHDPRAIVLSDAEQLEYSEEQIKFLTKRTFSDALNIGYHLTTVKLKYEHGKYLNFLKNVAMNERSAQRYVSIYRSFRELNTKKALAAFENIEISKLRELTRLSSANLNKLAQSPELINSIQQKTTDEFKQQMLPGLISGETENLTKMQRGLDHVQRELDSAQEKISEYRAQESSDGAEPQLISRTIEATDERAAAIIGEIKKIMSDAASINDGRHATEFALNSDANKVAVQIAMTNAARAVLAHASEFYNYATKHMSPPPRALDAMNDAEIAEVMADE